jgi:hypothetical protein
MWKPEYRSAAERDGYATAIKATYVLVPLDLCANGMQITCPLPLLILTPFEHQARPVWERPNIDPVPGSQHSPRSKDRDIPRSRRGPAKRKGQHACHGDCVPELIDDLQSRGHDR